MSRVSIHNSQTIPKQWRNAAVYFILTIDEGTGTAKRVKRATGALLYPFLWIVMLNVPAVGTAWLFVFVDGREHV